MHCTTPIHSLYLKFSSTHAHFLRHMYTHFREHNHKPEESRPRRSRRATKSFLSDVSSWVSFCALPYAENGTEGERQRERDRGRETGKRKERGRVIFRPCAFLHLHTHTLFLSLTHTHFTPPYARTQMYKHTHIHLLQCPLVGGPKRL